MQIINIFLLLLGMVHGLEAYALNEAVLPLMGDDRLYNTAPVPMPIAVVDTAPVAMTNRLDMTVTGTRSAKIPVTQNKKIGFFERVFGAGEGE